MYLFDGRSISLEMNLQNTLITFLVRKSLLCGQDVCDKCVFTANSFNDAFITTKHVCFIKFMSLEGLHEFHTTFRPVEW